MATYAELAGRTVLITGGANGIGQAMVEAFHVQGATVSFCDMDEAGGKRLAKRLAKRAEFTKVNLLRELEIKRWIAKVAKRHGSIDVLINNAARDPRIKFEDVSSKDFLGFKFGSRGYSDQLTSAVAKSGKLCAVKCEERVCVGRDGSRHKVVWLEHNFKFMGGSLGCAEGEVIARGFEHAGEQQPDNEPQQGELSQDRTAEAPIRALCRRCIRSDLHLCSHPRLPLLVQ